MKMKKLLIFLSAVYCLMPMAEARCCGKPCSGKKIIIGRCCKKTWTVWTSSSKKKKKTINRTERPKKVEINKAAIRTFYNEHAQTLKNVRRLGD